VRALGIAPVTLPQDSPPGRAAPISADARRSLVVLTTASLRLAMAFRRLHVPVYVARVESMDAVERSLDDLGLLLGKPLVARAIVTQIARERSEVETAIAGKRPVRVFFDAGGRRTVPADSLVGDLLAKAGAVSVAGPSPGGRPIAPTRLVQLRPQVYLTPRTSGVSLAKLRKSQLLRHLPAVRDDRFVRIPTDLLIAGPRIGDGLRLIALAVHPDAFR
jgi:iron complex transport system substrate-binding protein